MATITKIQGESISTVMAACATTMLFLNIFLHGYLAALFFLILASRTTYFYSLKEPIDLFLDVLML